MALAPTAALAAGFFALAWREQGSIVAEDWLAYALATALLLATVLLSGTAQRPPLALLAGLGALTAFALWTALSAQWSPVPALARDEGLLVLFYALALASAVATLRSDGERVGAVAIVVGTSVLIVVATAVRLITSDDPGTYYGGGRLISPAGYAGAQGAIFLVSFWPAAALAASRRLPVAARGIAFGAAVALLSGWLMTQSRAAAVALVLSAIVVVTLAPTRLRLLIPSLLSAGVVAAAYVPLTAPFREDGAARADAIDSAGRWALLLAVGGVLVGLAYAFVDTRVAVPVKLARASGVAALAVLAVGVVAVAAGFLFAVDRPGAYLQDRWDEFKREPKTETGSSHLVTLGSNRYDFWSVALGEFRAHPVAGAGGRSFAAAYLREGQTEETPQRGHSLVLDTAAETGLVGLALLVAGLIPFGRVIVRRARSELVAAGVLGAAAYWLVHASGDWIWTFPAAGLPFFLLLGAGAAGGGQTVRNRLGLMAGAVVAATAVLAFLPPWLSSRYTARALEQTPAAAADDLRWARRLDPLSVDPLVAEAELASPERAIDPLEKVVEKEPRSVASHYLLGLAYLRVGRVQDGRRELREARRLAPRSNPIERALRSASAKREGG